MRNSQHSTESTMAQVFLIPTVPNGLAAPGSGSKSQPTVATLAVVAKKRKVRRYDPEEEISALRGKLDEERTKRRELESEIYKLRQERSEMCIKMSRLEQSKIATNIPQSLVPMLTDAMAHGINPLAQSQSPAAPKTPAAPPRPVAKTTPGPGRPPNAAKVTPATAPAKAKPATASPKTAPKPATPTTNIPISAAPGQKFLIQQKTADGKVVSFLASVTANNTVTTADKAGTSSAPSTSSAPAVTTASASTEPSPPTATATEQISPESPPPEAASANPPVQAAE